MRKLILALCAIALCLSYVGCTDPAEGTPKNGGPSSSSPEKPKTDS